MEDVSGHDDEIRDMDIDDIPGLEDMQMPSDDESDDEFDSEDGEDDSDDSDDSTQHPTEETHTSTLTHWHTSTLAHRQH